MRRTITRGLALAAIGTLGLTGPAYAGTTTGSGGGGPDPVVDGPPPVTLGPAYGPTYDPRVSPDDPAAAPDATTPGGDTPTQPTDSPPAPTDVPSPSGTSATATPTDTPTPTPTHSAPTQRPAHVRLHTAITGAQSDGSSLVGYAIRVRATGGAAHAVIATISVRPHAARLAKPAACHGGAPTHCRLGDLRHARLLAFREQPGHATRRITVDVTVTAANAPATSTSMVLILRRPPRHTARPTVPHQAPPAAVVHRAPEPATHPVVTAPAPPPAVAPPAVAPPAAAPPVTTVSPPDVAQQPLNPGLSREQAAPPMPRLPVVAPRPGPNPTPDGAPVTVRPVANGHPITGGSRMPTRTIIGILGAAASFVGLVTALVLIRRRHEA